MGKYAILVHADENQVGRAIHALLYAKELNENGHQVEIIFDGAGTRWIPKFEDKDFPYRSLYAEVKELGLIAGACEYCASAFKVAEALEPADIKPIGDYHGHPSLATLLEAGYQSIIL